MEDAPAPPPPPAPPCEVIQGAELALASPGATPLVLIHDGGGTTFGYHCLDPLRRPVYGIANPHFESGDPWPGGVPQMAALYAAMIRRTVSSPDFPRQAASSSSRARILLGGWSFGGMLALHVAWLLRDDPAVRVVGLLPIDTPFPFVRAQDPPEPPTSFREDGDDNKPLRKNEVLARQAMVAAREMIRAWALPDWRDKDPASAGSAQDQLPPAVLVRAASAVAAPEEKSGQTTLVDRFRADASLGWGSWEGHHLVRDVVDVEGHHYDIFTFSRVAATTRGIIKACALLDDLAG